MAVIVVARPMMRLLKALVLARGGNCPQGNYTSFGLNKDVIYHEYGHAILDQIYLNRLQGADTEAGAMDEGFSDYFACTTDGDSEFGEGVPITPGRDLDNSYTVQIHWKKNDPWHNGQIIGGAVWDVRSSSVGVTATNNIFFEALFFEERRFSDFLEAMLLADDDENGNSDPCDATPNENAIRWAFTLHGISTGSLPCGPEKRGLQTSTWLCLRSFR